MAKTKKPSTVDALLQLQEMLVPIHNLAKFHIHNINMDIAHQEKLKAEAEAAEQESEGATLELED